MTTRIENVKHTLFVSKEHYLAFRQSWKDSINDGYCPSAAQFMLFSILTEQDMSKAFPPPKNENKKGFEEALNGWYGTSLISCINAAKAATGGGKKPDYMSEEKYRQSLEAKRETVERFLKPFGKSVTVEMIAKLADRLPEIANLTNKVETMEKAA